MTPEEERDHVQWSDTDRDDLWVLAVMGILLALAIVGWLT